MWRCPSCGRFLANRRCVHIGEGYSATWISKGDCSRHGSVTPLAAWEELWGDFDPETTDV
jgi:hypothetical protein